MGVSGSWFAAASARLAAARLPNSTVLRGFRYPVRPPSRLSKS
jgi:hypothetical protein